MFAMFFIVLFVLLDTAEKQNTQHATLFIFDFGKKN